MDTSAIKAGTRVEPEALGSVYSTHRPAAAAGLALVASRGELLAAYPNTRSIYVPQLHTPKTRGGPTFNPRLF